MRVAYSVTFEFATQPPLTYRGVVSGGHPATCMRHATKNAYQALKPVRWSSVVCVLLERLPDELEKDAA